MEMALPSHYQGEGTEFLERVCNCTDREDVVVRALKELNTGQRLMSQGMARKGQPGTLLR